MKKVTKLVYNFPLLLLFLSGCVKQKPVSLIPATQIPAAASPDTALIIASPYVRSSAQQSEQVVPQEPTPVCQESISTPQERFKEIEARSYDIYFPLGYSLVTCVQDKKEIVIEGSVDGALVDLARSCMQEMEQFGWASVVTSQVEPVLMVFTKPGRSCAYRIVQHKPSWFSKKQVVSVTIWIGYRS